MSEELQKSGNGYGVAGFIISVIAVVMAFIKVKTSFIDGWEWILYAVLVFGAVLSAMGLQRRPRFWAYAGLVVCFVAILVVYFVAETVATPV